MKYLGILILALILYELIRIEHRITMLDNKFNVLVFQACEGD